MSHRVRKTAWVNVESFLEGLDLPFYPKRTLVVRVLECYFCAQNLR